MAKSEYSSQLQPKFHSHAAQTQDSMRPGREEYTGDSNVKRGGSQYAEGGKAGSGGGKKGDVAPSAGPKSYTSNDDR